MNIIKVEREIRKSGKHGYPVFDTKLENGVVLKDEHWVEDKEVFITSNDTYKPIYVQVDEDEYELIGFEIIE